MDGRWSVAGGSHRGGVHQADACCSVRLGLDGIDNVLNCSGVNCSGSLGVVIGCRGDQRHSIQNPVGAANSFHHVSIAGGVTPNDFQALSFNHAASRD